MRARASLLAALLALVACGGGDGDGDASSSTITDATTAATTATTAPAEVRTVVVTNDDGVRAPGIDAVVEALAGRPDLELVVVAPAEQQSGSGDATTPGGAPGSPATTRSGHEAVAVAGEPADAVIHALDVVLAGEAPDLVVSGINEGQNLGPVVDVSGTVGAARTAARRGIPAVAVSAGLPPEGVAEPDYEAGVEALLAWLDEHLGELEAGSFANINVPTCATGDVRGTVEVASATDETNGPAIGPSDCASTLTDPVDDVQAFAHGFVAVTEPGLGS